MPDFLIKSIFAIGLLAAASAAFLSMMTLMGRMEKKTDSLKLRRVHRTAGLVFILVLAPLVYFGLGFLSEMGDALPLRGVLHVLLAFTLIVIFSLKLLVVRLYKQFLRVVPGLGMTVFVLTVIIFLMTAGVFFLRSISRGPLVDTEVEVTSSPLPGRPAEGEKTFRENCLSCHPLDGKAQGFGPSLKGIFIKKTLPASGRPSVPPNIIRQIRTPMGKMPAFPHLTEREIADLLAYFINL